VADDLRVDDRVTIPGWELVEVFTPSGGPGGQHANRSSTRVELRFEVEASSALTPAQKRLVASRLGASVRVVADDERSQARNRALARERLAASVAAALVPRRRRVATRPTRGSRERRLDDKRQRSERKAARRPPRLDE